MVDLSANYNVTDLLLAPDERAPKAPLYAVTPGGSWNDVSTEFLLDHVRALANS